MRRHPDRRAGDLRSLWVQVLQTSWSSLAVIPAEPGMPVGQVTAAAAELSGLFDLGELRVIDSQGASLIDGSSASDHAAAATREGARVIIAVDAPLWNAGAIPLILSAEAALILVRMGSTRIDSVRRIAALVGRERILGCASLDAPHPGEAALAPLGGP